MSSEIRSVYEPLISGDIQATHAKEEHVLNQPVEFDRAANLNRARD